jgi:putative hemolysin
LAVILAILVILDLVTIAARTGLFQTSLGRLIAQREPADRRVQRVADLLRTQPQLKSSFQLFELLLRFGVAVIILELFLTNDTSPISWLAGFGVLMLAALLLFGLEEIVEGTVSRRPEMWAARLAPYARILMFLMSPVLVLSLAFSQSETTTRDSNSMVTEDELKNLVDAGHQEGLLEQDEREMIYSIFRLGETLVREIMVPRIDFTALEVNTLIEQAVDAVIASGYSRVPVYEETVDHIIGILYIKDLVRIFREGATGLSLKELLRQAYFVPEAKKVDELLDEMQARRVHMAIVVDEYGGVAGLVTLEDIVEEIVGEIRDEFDQAEEQPFQAIDENTVIFLGRVDIYDFNGIMGVNLHREEAETIGGFIYGRIGRVPEEGESVEVDGVRLTVEQVSGRRIRKVRAERIPAIQKPEAEGNDN